MIPGEPISSAITFTTTRILTVRALVDRGENVEGRAGNARVLAIADGRGDSVAPDPGHPPLHLAAPPPLLPHVKPIRPKTESSV